MVKQSEAAETMGIVQPLGFIPQNPVYPTIGEFFTYLVPGFDVFPYEFCQHPELTTLCKDGNPPCMMFVFHWCGNDGYLIPNSDADGTGYGSEYGGGSSGGGGSGRTWADIYEETLQNGGDTTHLEPMMRCYEEGYMAECSPDRKAIQNLSYSVLENSSDHKKLRSYFRDYPYKDVYTKRNSNGTNNIIYSFHILMGANKLLTCYDLDSYMNDNVMYPVDCNTWSYPDNETYVFTNQNYFLNKAVESSGKENFLGHMTVQETRKFQYVENFMDLDFRYSRADIGYLAYGQSKGYWHPDAHDQVDYAKHIVPAFLDTTARNDGAWEVEPPIEDCDKPDQSFMLFALNDECPTQPPVNDGDCDICYCLETIQYLLENMLDANFQSIDILELMKTNAINFSKDVNKKLDTIISLLEELKDTFVSEEEGFNFWKGLSSMFGDFLDFVEFIIEKVIYLVIPEDSSQILTAFTTLSDSLNAKIEPVQLLKDNFTSVMNVEEKKFADVNVVLPIYGRVEFFDSTYVMAAVPYARNLISGMMIIVTGIWAYRKISSGVIK